jgi:hypothetical protein
MIHTLSTGLPSRITNKHAEKSKFGESPVKKQLSLRSFFPVYTALSPSYSWQAFKKFRTQLSPITHN